MDFYVTNISKCDMNLYDLGITVRSMTTINLLSRKSTITKQQLLESCLKGSISKNIKTNMLIIKLNAPKVEKKTLEKANVFLNSRVKTAFKIEKKEISEISEMYASQKEADEKMIKEILDGED